MLIDRLKQNYWIIIFTIYLRYLIGATFVFSSIVKISSKRFTTDSGVDTPINTAWHFFETLYQSGLYWNFIGWCQFIAGLILMTQRLRTLGAMLYLPIALNIFVITVSYQFPGTPYITGLLLLCSIYLLVWDYKQVSPLLNLKTYDREDVKSDIEDEKYWSILGILFFIETVVCVILKDREPTLWFFICVLTGIVGLIIYRKKKKFNGS